MHRDQATAAKALAAAEEVLVSNHRTGHSVAAGRYYDYTCPSPDSYPFQWAWDSCYHAIALTHLDPARAQAELVSLVSAAAPGGFLPHMALWQDDLRTRATEDFRIALWGGWTSVTIAPPVLARCVERVLEVTHDRAWLAEVLPPTVAFFSWLARRRLSSASGLLTTFQPDESGLDASPKYDEALGLASCATGGVAAGWHEAMHKLLLDYQNGRTPDTDLSALRRFVWHDLLLNSIYADGLRCLSRLMRVAGESAERAVRAEARADAVTQAMLARCWDERRGVFWDLDAVSGTPARVLTASSLFPLILDALPAGHARRLVDEHLLSEKEFWLPHPVPSVAATEPSFDPTFSTGAIFRGSSWVNLNWYLYWGLRTHHRDDVASELARQTLAMTARAGMRECYGPLDGAGHGARSFGWSALVLDLAHAERLGNHATQLRKEVTTP